MCEIDDESLVEFSNLKQWDMSTVTYNLKIYDDGYNLKLSTSCKSFKGLLEEYNYYRKFHHNIEIFQWVGGKKIGIVDIILSTIIERLYRNALVS